MLLPVAAFLAVVAIAASIALLIVCQRILRIVYHRDTAAASNDRRRRVQRMTVSDYRYRQLGAAVAIVGALVMLGLCTLHHGQIDTTTQTIEHVAFVGLIGLTAIVMLVLLSASAADYRDQKRLERD